MLFKYPLVKNKTNRLGVFKPNRTVRSIVGASSDLIENMEDLILDTEQRISSAIDPTQYLEKN